MYSLICSFVTSSALFFDLKILEYHSVVTSTAFFVLYVVFHPKNFLAFELSICKFCCSWNLFLFNNLILPLPQELIINSTIFLTVTEFLVSVPKFQAPENFKGSSNCFFARKRYPLSGSNTNCHGRLKFGFLKRIFLFLDNDLMQLVIIQIKTKHYLIV